MSGFTGVKQAEFDAMTSKHAEAATRLEELSRTLHRELQTAGLDTTPAARLRELAARVTKQTEDLRRRQKLVHELQRQKVTFGQNTPSNTFVGMPDRLDDAQDLLDGTLAGRAATKAADGDEKALKELEKYASRAGDSEFVKAFLTTLGPRGLTRLPGSIAIRLRDAVRGGDAARQKSLAGSGHTILALLGKVLAKGTNPRDRAYMGDQFVNGLRAEGRAQHPLGGKATYQGYQAQALIWQAHDGKPPFSPEFMENIASDVIIQERHQRETAWKVSEKYRWLQRPSPDLAGVLGLGSLLKPPGLYEKVPTESSMVEPLLRSAASNRELAQALLGYSMPGFKQTVLQYFLTARMGVFDHLDDAALLSKMLLTATTGQDATSKKLSAEMIKVLSDQISSTFNKKTEDLEISDRALFDRYTHLSYPLSRAIAANIDRLQSLYLHHKNFYAVTPSDMTYALALATSDAQGFETLVRTQTEHMRAALGGAPPVGMNAANAHRFGFTKAEVKEFDLNGNGQIDHSDTLEYLDDRVAEEAAPFNHLLETRRQVLLARGLDDQKADEALRTMVADAIGLIPVPGAKQMGELANGALGELISAGYGKLADLAYDELAQQVSQRMSQVTPNLDETYRTLASNRLAVNQLGEQLISTAMLGKGMLDATSLSGRSFTTGSPPKIKPFTRMSPDEYSDYLEWVREKGGASSLMDSFSDDLGDPSTVRSYLQLKSASSGGSS